MKKLEGGYPPLKIRALPAPPPWQKAVGVGLLAVGVAMGSGELVIWPVLTVQHGLNLLWFALLGISAQYIVNQEVARLTLATGEGFFTASARISKWFAPFWALSVVLLYVWPGWASAVGTMLAELFGVGSYLAWAYGALGAMVCLTLLGRTAYRMLEGALRGIVPAFFLMLVTVTVANAKFADWNAIGQSIFSLPNWRAVDASLLLSAIVFSGAGGMLNLCVSLWYRDKQLGMVKYGGKIENPITGKEEAVPAIGATFTPTAEALTRWRGWMRFVYADQGVIFWFLGFLTLALLSINAYIVLVPLGLTPEGISVATAQAEIFGRHWGEVGKILYLAMASLMLFSVMWAVVDVLARTVSDILYTNANAGPFMRTLRGLRNCSMSRMYYAAVIAVVLVGAALLPYKQPLTLLTISAVLGGFTMAVYTPLLFYHNNFRLPKPLRPGLVTNIGLIAASLLFIYFAARVIGQLFA